MGKGRCGQDKGHFQIWDFLPNFGTKDAQIHKICHQLLSDQLTHQGQRCITIYSYIS